LGVIRGHVWYVEVRAIAWSGWDVEWRAVAIPHTLDTIEDARKVRGGVFGIWHIAIVAIAVVVIVVFVVRGIKFSGVM
jgi:t-SNARE complex subunit (syntaxin)